MIDREQFFACAEKFGTPLYVYDEAAIERQADALLSAVTYPQQTFLFAMKANSNPWIMDVLKDKGFGIDAVSPGEVELALQTGFAPKDIVFTGNNLSGDEIDFALERGVVINADSLSILEKVGIRSAAAGKDTDVCIRINSNMGAGHHPHCITGGPASKFGIWHSQISRALSIADSFPLRIVGVHHHIGSQILDSDLLLRAARVLLKTVSQFPRLSKLEFVDFGGGLGVPYKPEDKPLDVSAFGFAISHIFAQFCATYGRELNLVLEPGRFLVAEAGYLLVKVTGVKRNPDGRVFVGVNSGFNHLIRPAMYGSYHRIDNISHPSRKKEVVDVVGNICESGDRFAKDREIAAPTEDDLLLIRTAGAYGYSMASPYNSRPRPAEVIVTKAGRLKLIREREEIASLIVP